MPNDTYRLILNSLTKPRLLTSLRREGYHKKRKDGEKLTSEREKARYIERLKSGYEKQNLVLRQLEDKLDLDCERIVADTNRQARELFESIRREKEVFDGANGTEKPIAGTF